MNIFEVGGIYVEKSDSMTDGTHWVCVWRGGGSKPKVHLVEQWEHDMNIQLEMDDYAYDRKENGLTAGNDVYSIHVQGDSECVKWNGETYELYASSKIDQINVKTGKSKKEKKNTDVVKEKPKKTIEIKMLEPEKKHVFLDFFKWFFFSKPKYSKR